MWKNKVECPNCHNILYDMEEQEVIYHCYYHLLYSIMDVLDSDFII